MRSEEYAEDETQTKTKVREQEWAGGGLLPGKVYSKFANNIIGFEPVLRTIKIKFSFPHLCYPTCDYWREFDPMPQSERWQINEPIKVLRFHAYVLSL